MVLEVGQVLHLSLGGDERLVTQPFPAPAPYLGPHLLVGLLVQQLGLGVDYDQVEGPSVLVPSGLAFLDGRLSLLDGLGLLCLGASCTS